MPTTREKVQSGQHRAHHRTGLAIKVIRQRPKAKDWITRYLPDSSPRTMSERTLLDYYPVIS